MGDFLGELARRKCLVADGALGTQLMERRIEPGQAPEMVNLHRPELLAEIADAYLAAGAEILTANTFGASPLKLRAHHLEDRTEEVNARAVTILKEVAGTRAFVSGSVGPSGVLLEPYGDASEEEVYHSFERQARALVDAGTDLICVETMTDLREAMLAVRAARSIAPDIPLIATMTFNTTPRGFFTMMGNSVPDAAAGLEEAGADLVGTNCGNGIVTMARIAEEFARHSRLPIVVQSNAGLPRLSGETLTYDESPESWAQPVEEMTSLPAAVIGGCCGTTPEHIRTIRERVRAAFP